MRNFYAFNEILNVNGLLSVTLAHCTYTNSSVYFSLVLYMTGNVQDMNSFDNTTVPVEYDDFNFNKTDNAVHVDSNFSSHIVSDDVEARYSSYVANGYETVLSSNDNNSNKSSDQRASGKYYLELRSVILHLYEINKTLLIYIIYILSFLIIEHINAYQQ